MSQAFVYTSSSTWTKMWDVWKCSLASNIKLRYPLKIWYSGGLGVSGGYFSIEASVSNEEIQLSNENHN